MEPIERFWCDKLGIGCGPSTGLRAGPPRGWDVTRIWRGWAIGENLFRVETTRGYSGC